jgi:hypothetical protein
MPSIGAIAPIGSSSLRSRVAGHVATDFQYTSKNRVDCSEIEGARKVCTSKLGSTKVTNYIDTIANYKQRRNDLSAILICLAHVLRRAKPLKHMIV